MPARDPDTTVYLLHLGQDEVDQLPFGMITLDREGAVIGYNATEARLSGFDPKAVLGRNFFADVAPCTNVQAFGGLYRSLVRSNEPRACEFDFVFRFAHGDAKVRITMVYLQKLGKGLLLVDQQPLAR